MNLSTTDYEVIWVDFWLNLVAVSIIANHCESNLFSTSRRHIRWVWWSSGSYFGTTESGQNTVMAKSNEPDMPTKRSVFTTPKFDQNSGHIRPVT